MTCTCARAQTCDRVCVPGLRQQDLLVAHMCVQVGAAAERTRAALVCLQVGTLQQRATVAVGEKKNTELKQESRVHYRVKLSWSKVTPERRSSRRWRRRVGSSGSQLFGII